MTNQPTAMLATPVDQQERIILLDSLRGIAVLGILVMNMTGFALPGNSIEDLSIRNEYSGLNYISWWIDFWFLEGTQRSLFSMLFGAGVALFLSRLEKRMDGIMPAEYFIRRQLWLLLFGLFNAYILLWFWDILFHYAIFGIVLFAFRRQSSKVLLIAAGVCFLLAIARENVDFYRDKRMVAKGELVAKIDTLKTPLTDIQKEELGELDELKQSQTKEAKEKRANKNIQAVRGDYNSLYKIHSEKSYRGETTGTFYFLAWDILLFMFIGMAFFKNGILTGVGKTKIYWILFLVGFGLGLPLSYLRIQPLLIHHFNHYDYLKNVSFEFYQLSRLLRAIGFFALIMLMYKSGSFKWLFALMRPVGQMAFTNYLMQSFLCGVFFYGVGFGMFGQIQRYEMFYIILCVWGIEIAWSHIWLRYFRFGPLEWLWRSLTYWKKQPFKK